VDVIPKFINTPLDVLALGLFDLIAPLALGVASIDGRIDLSERQVITSYFVKEWGYDPSFVEKGVAFTESKLADYKIKTLAEMLAEFQKKNPDCNYKMMSNEIVEFLRSVIEADGKIDEREEMAVERVMKTFETVGKFNFKEMFETASNTMTSSLCTAKVKSIELASKTAETASEVVDSLKEHGEKTAKMLSEVSDTTVAHGKRLCECIISKCSKQHGVE
jgi:predicted small metal-binding protein